MARRGAKAQSAYQFHAMIKLIIDYLLPLIREGQLNNSTVKLFMARRGAKAQSAYQFHALKKFIVDYLLFERDN
jgi:hypothetical protein